MDAFYLSSSSHFSQKKFLRMAQTSNCLNHAATASISITPKESNTKQPILPYNNTDEFSMKHEQKLEEVRNLLWKAREDPLESVVMVDDLQRLCIDYHFKEEIGHILNIQRNNSGMSPHNHQNDLYEVSTRFRLLRQQGYYVSTDVFNNFKDEKGGFKAEMRSNIRGLMSLYEASHLSIEGEDILDQAAEFSAPLLKRWMTSIDQNRARVVDNALRFPRHKSLPRLIFHRTIGDYKGLPRSDSVLQELAAIDFSLVQSTYQKEVHQVFKWWEDKRLDKELAFARIQPLKWYMCSVAALTDPTHSDERIELTKPISLIYIIDDIFDVYGTVQQLTRFTEAVDKWDISATEQLPNCMKICFKALDDITNEIGYKVHKKHGWNPIYSLRRSWASLCNGFLIEAKWLASGQLPKAEEYLKNGVITSGVHVLLVHMFFLLGQGINEETINLLDGNPGIATSTATILRLWDDLGSAKDENQEGRDGSYSECYMKEHDGISAECAKMQTVHLISKAWRNLNKECLSPHQFPETFRTGCLNIARMVPLMYSYDENQKLPILEEFKKSLLHDNVSL